MLATVSRIALNIFACALLAFFCASHVTFAQSQASSGNIEGRVLDPQQAAVPNVTVTTTNQATGLERSATTDDDGNYRIVLLPPGSYTVRTSGVSGFTPAEARDVIVTVGGITPLDIALTVGGAQETVVIDDFGSQPVVETTRTSVSSTVNERAIENLPVNGRNYLDFATLTPAVTRDPTRQGDLAVGGQRGTLNSLQVDGVDNNNTFFGQAFGRTGVRPPYQFSEESVQEFQINQNGFSAEFGRAGGAVINVVTKSGTNDFRGGVFEYFRDEALNANPPLQKARIIGGRPVANVRLPLQINQFGGRIGGPIVKNRAFFFFTYDGQRSNQPNAIILPSLAAQPANIQTLLAGRVTPYEIGRDQDVFLVKTDINLNTANNLSVRFNRQNFTGVNNENSGALSAEEHSGDSVARTTTVSGTLASAISPQVLNEFRFQFARDAEPGEANSDQPEARIQTSDGFFFIGRNNFSPRETTIRRAQFVDNISYLTGRHAFKFGADLNFDRILNFFPGLFTGQYTFPSYAAFLANTPSAFTQNFPGANTDGPTTHPDSSDYGFFAQDDFRVTPKLTLNLGVRYDYQKLSAPPIRNDDPALLNAGFDTSRRPADKNNFAPRLGFSYAFDDRTVLRGGYGIFYGRTPAIVLGTAHSQNGIQVSGVSLTTPAAITAAGLTYPNILTAPPATGGASPSLFLFAEGYTQPYVQQARLGFEREVFANTSVSVTYLLYRGVHLTRTRDVNLGAPTEVGFAFGANASAIPGQGSTFQRFDAPRPFRRATGARVDYARINLFESNANSLYNGLATQVTRRFANNFQFIASYTFSKAEDDKPDATAVVVGADDIKFVQNQLDLRAEYGTSDLDIRHRFVFSPVYEFGKFTRSENRFLRALLSDYTVSSIVQLQSGFAYSATVTGDLNRDGNSNNDRVPGTERNGFRTEPTYQFSTLR